MFELRLVRGSIHEALRNPGLLAVSSFGDRVCGPGEVLLWEGCETLV